MICITSFVMEGMDGYLPNIIQDDYHASSDACSLSACMCTWDKVSFYLTKVLQSALFLIQVSN